jgi:hypothetical protein
MNSSFLSKENISTIWEVIMDEDIFKFLTRDVQENIFKMFSSNIKAFYEVEKIKTIHLMDLNKKSLWCLSFYIITFSLLVFILLIAYIVFLMIGLITTSIIDEYKLCNNSHLWIYSLILLLLILKIKNIFNIFTKDDYIKNNYVLIFLDILINIGIIVWGIYEFYIIKCTINLSDTMLYKTTYICWIINIILLGFVSLFIFYKSISNN